MYRDNFGTNVSKLSSIQEIRVRLFRDAVFSKNAFWVLDLPVCGGDSRFVCMWLDFTRLSNVPADLLPFVHVTCCCSVVRVLFRIVACCCSILRARAQRTRSRVYPWWFRTWRFLLPSWTPSSRTRLISKLSCPELLSSSSLTRRRSHMLT